MVIWIYSNSTAGYRSKGIEMRIRKSHLYPHVYRHTIHSNQAMESAEIFVDRWMEKESLTCAYNGILALRRKGILSFVAAMMGLEGIMLNKSQKDKYWIFEFACGTQRVAINKGNNRNLIARSWWLLHLHTCVERPYCTSQICTTSLVH